MLLIHGKVMEKDEFIMFIQCYSNAAYGKVMNEKLKAVYISSKISKYVRAHVQIKNS